MKSIVLTLAGLAITSGIASHAFGQRVLTGTSYLETFDNVGTGLPVGWTVRTNATRTALGTPVNFVNQATNWGSSSGQFANYASTINSGTNFVGTESPTIQAACTNRCIAMRQTGSYGDPGAAFVLQLQDTINFANFQLQVDFDLLSVQNRTNSWVVDYGLGSAPASFTAVWTNIAQVSLARPRER